MLLVIPSDRQILRSMGLMSWYRRLFQSAPTGAGVKATEVAAEAGDPDAQFAMGLHYSSGTTAPPQLDQAAHWYRKAADQNHRLAQFNLGQMFAHGQGRPQDDVTAVHWIRRSAEGGDAGAQFNLGSRYHRHSVGTDLLDHAESRIEAYKWYHLAAGQGYDGSALQCERLALGMTREEVTDGNERVAAFLIRPVSAEFPSNPLASS
jgi:TPR repeat protein